MNKLVIIESSGPIRAMNNINGPIKTPCSLSINVISDLINDNKIVYEVNPKNYNEKIRLTRLNLFSDNFPSQIKSQVLNNKKMIRDTIKRRIVRINNAHKTKIKNDNDSDKNSILTNSFISNKNNKFKKRKRR